LITLEGTVEEIIYKNEDNGYTVAMMETKDDVVTIVGYIPFLNIGETLKVEGEWSYHPNYGEQFKIENASTVVPATVNGIEKYLSSGLIPCIGPKTAQKIVEKFGVDSLDIIHYNPEKLKEIEGIGDKKIKKISEAFEEQRDLRDIMVFLQQYGITATYGVKIYKKYGKETIKIISENPYRLSEDIFGIGFKTADKIAQSMGVDPRSPYRIEAGIKFVLMEYAGNGHSYVPKKELFVKVSKLLSLKEDLIDESLRDLALKGDIHLEYIEEEIFQMDISL
jgi:exodeoxyribonuclease V alpha subunit